MKIAVVGAGGVGGYFGGRLARHGNDVFFLARGAHLKALKEDGLQVKSTRGDFRIDPIQATADPNDIPPSDVVMVCTKSWDLVQAAAMMKPFVQKHTMIIPFLNGIKVVETLAAIFGARSVLGGVAYVVSTIVSPGVIVQSSRVQRIAFGEVNKEVTERLKQFHAVCTQAGVDAEMSADIEKAMWDKFIFICAYCGVTSLLRTPLGNILQDRDARKLYEDCMREVFVVGKALGRQIDDDIVERQMAFSETMDPASTSSMQRDVERGSPLELEVLNGEVVRQGRKLGIQTPVNSFLWAALKLHAHGRTS